MGTQTAWMRDASAAKRLLSRLVCSRTSVDWRTNLSGVGTQAPTASRRSMRRVASLLIGVAARVCHALNAVDPKWTVEDGRAGRSGHSGPLRRRSGHVKRQSVRLTGAED